jgi:hypothetical protein
LEQTKPKKKSVLKRILKIVGWIVASIFLLLLLVVLLIQIPAVQNFGRKKIVDFLEEKIGTKVQIDALSIRFPKKVVLKGVFFEDQAKDTLLAGKELAVDISMFKLLKNTVEINEIDLDGITAHISRNSKGEFNFDYIVQAFTSEQEKPVTEDSSSMKFSVDEINLDKINLKYHDDIMGYDVVFGLRHFDTDIKTFDLDKFKFAIDAINIVGINAAVRQFKPLGNNLPNADSVSAGLDTAAAKPLDLELNDINLANINFDYKNEIDSMFAVLNLGKLKIDPKKIDMARQSISLKQLLLENTTANIRLGKKTAAQQAAEKIAVAADSAAATIQQQGWTFAVEEIVFNNNNFKFDNDASAPLIKGMDYSHLDLKNVNLEIDKLHFQNDSIAASIGDLNFKDKSGVQVNKLQTNFAYTNQQAYLKDLYLETPNTKIQRSVSLQYPSIESLSKNINELQIDADLTGTSIGYKDILYFVPDLATQPMFAKNPTGKLRADVVIKGKVNNLQIQKFEASTLGRTHIKLSGHITGLPDINKTFANVRVDDISTTDVDIISLLPKGSLPDNIRVPQRVTVTGTVVGGMPKLSTNLAMRTSFGNVGLKGTISNPTDSIKAVYDAAIALNNFNVGQLIKQEKEVGAITLTTQVKGVGYTPSRMTAQLEGVVRSAEVKGYTYKNFAFSGGGSKGLFDLKADITDPNIDLNLIAHANLNGKNPAITAELMLDSIALQPLNLATVNIKVHTKLSADIPNLDIDHLQGNILVTELLVNTPKQRFIMDTIRVNAESNGDTNSIALYSPIANARLHGRYTFTGIGTAATDIINKYYNISTTTAATPAKPGKKTVVKDTTVQDAAFNITLFNSAFLKEMIPDLKLGDSVILNGRLNGATNSLFVNGYIPRVTYGSSQIGKAFLKIRTTDSALVYELAIDQIKSGTFNVPFATLTGQVANNKLGFNLSVVDNKLAEQFLLAGSVLQQNGNYQLSLLKDGLKLDYDYWTVNPDNKLLFGKDGIRADNFILTNTTQSLAIQSTEQGNNSPLEVKFNNFKIESITKIVQQDSLAVGGTINGNTVITNLDKSPVFVADLKVNSFNYQKDTIGDISIKVDNKVAYTYATDVSVIGNGNSLFVKGNYFATDKGSFDLDVNLEKLNLATIESFTNGAVKQLAGYLEGKMKVTGSIDQPNVIGNLDFKKVAMNPSMLNSRFRMDDERISFKEDGIHFNNFTLKDSLNNEAVITGAILSNNYKDFKFNLDVDADDFMVLNSQKKDNPLYYGTLYIDTKIRVRGDLDNPRVNADLTVNPKTKLTIVLPQSDPQVAAREGIVEFFDQDHQNLDSMLLARYDSLNNSEIKGLDVVANLTIDKEAEFNLIIDESNGDFVNLSGEGNLSGGIDPSGKISLTGTYEIEKGAYEMSFSLLKRKFSIQKGSSLTWTGEPTSANVNITAVYVANTAPINLVEQQLGQDITPTEKNTYKQNLPFNVLLTMSGELLKPDIGFDITLPEGNYNVSTEVLNKSNAKLDQIRQEPGEMNKQVFALLLLNRFIAENPFASSSGSTSATTMAKQSVSKILAEQLNRLAADLVTGVELNFGLETTNDYSSGQQQDRTELNVGVSKQLLNDRLRVTVGSNFELEGPQQANQKTSNIAGNVQVDYKLSKDGTYTLRGYRIDQYEVALQGQVVETGLTFIISLDYDKFREIFERRRANKETRKQNKADAKKEEEQRKLEEASDKDKQQL